MNQYKPPTWTNINPQHEPISTPKITWNSLRPAVAPPWPCCFWSWLDGEPKSKAPTRRSIPLGGIGASNGNYVHCCIGMWISCMFRDMFAEIFADIFMVKYIYTYVIFEIYIYVPCIFMCFKIKGTSMGLPVSSVLAPVGSPRLSNTSC